MYYSKVRKVGNSHAVLLPAQLLRFWGVEAGDELELQIDANRLVIQPSTGAEERASFIEAAEEVLREDARVFKELAK